MSDMTTCANCEQEFDMSEPGCPACGHLLEAGECAMHAGAAAAGQCVICGAGVCSECNGDGTHYSCPAHQGIPVFEGWAQIYLAGDEFEAQIMRENLIAEGIDAEVLSQSDQTIRVNVGEFSSIRVLVPAFDYLTAVEFVQPRQEGEA